MIKKILLFVLGALIFPDMTTAAAPVIMGVIDNIISVTRIVAYALVIIFYIITGILFLSARGSPEGISTAKKSLIWTIVGTVLVILAEVAGVIVRNALNFGI